MSQGTRGRTAGCTVDSSCQTIRARQISRDTDSPVTVPYLSMTLVLMMQENEGGGVDKDEILEKEWEEMRRETDFTKESKMVFDRLV